MRCRGRWRDPVELADERSSICIITAWNPWSEPRGRARNALANAVLSFALLRFGRVRRSVGCDREQPPRWREPGFAVETTNPEAVARLGVRFGQHAIFVARSSGLEVLAC